MNSCQPHIVATYKVVHQSLWNTIIPSSRLHISLTLCRSWAHLLFLGTYNTFINI